MVAGPPNRIRRQFRRSNGDDKAHRFSVVAGPDLNLHIDFEGRMIATESLLRYQPEFLVHSLGADSPDWSRGFASFSDPTCVASPWRVRLGGSLALNGREPIAFDNLSTGNARVPENVGARFRSLRQLPTPAGYS